MQKLYEHKRTRYIWNFPDLKLSFCEIPKTGSSSTKTVLFRSNYKLPLDYKLNVGGGYLKNHFPDSVVNTYDPEDLLERVLIIYRDPIARVKSAYRGIFIRRQGMEGALSEYFEKYLPAYLESDPSDGLLNHHKPMTWFFPKFLIHDSRSIFVETPALNSLPERLNLDMEYTPTKGAAMPHFLKMNKNLGDIDMSDEEIKTALGAAFDDDFSLCEQLDTPK